jgi:hypothetical protein
VWLVQVVIWWSFSSCTSKLKVLSNDMFLGDSGKRTLFNITHMSAVDISPYSVYPEEAEVLAIAIDLRVCVLYSCGHMLCFVAARVDVEVCACFYVDRNADLSCVVCRCCFPRAHSRWIVCCPRVRPPLCSCAKFPLPPPCSPRHRLRSVGSCKMTIRHPPRNAVVLELQVKGLKVTYLLSK